MKFRLTQLLPLLLAPVLLVGCEEELPEIDCNTVTVPTYSEVTIWPKCTSCHASTLTGDARNDAPEDVNFDTYEAAKEHAEKAVEEVFEGKMPEPDPSIITEEEKQSLYAWGLCGTPE